MKFDAEDPDEVAKSGEGVNRSQGAAKAITVRTIRYWLAEQRFTRVCI